MQCLLRQFLSQLVIFRFAVCTSLLVFVFALFSSPVLANESPKDPALIGEAPVAISSTDARSYDLSIQFKSGTHYELSDAPYSHENMHQFEELTAEEQKKFLSRRELYLSKVASLLHYTKLIYGTGSVVTNKVSQIAAPVLDVVKSKFAVAFDRSKNMLMVPYSHLSAWFKNREHESPVLIASQAGLSKAKTLFAKANAKLKKFNNWAIQKIYGNQPEQNQLAPPILQLAVAAETIETSATKSNEEIHTLDSMAESTSIPSTNSSKLSLGERIQQQGKKIVYSLLTKLDRTLWEHSRLVVSHNEAVVFLSVSVAGFHGVGTQVSGGLPHGLGLKLGINWSTKSLAFEIYHETEVLSRAVTPSTGYGLIPKLGVAILSQIEGSEMSAREGYYIYPPSPPGVPLAPGFTAMLKDQLAIGYTTSTATLPFSFVSDVFWYDTTVIQKPLIRVTFSPKVLGFFRVHFLSSAPARKPQSEVAATQEGSAATQDGSIENPVQLIAAAVKDREAQSRSSCADIFKKVD